MSTDEPTSSAEHLGLAYWIPELLAALDTDRAGAGRRVREIVAGRSARIGLDDDVIVVWSAGVGQLSVGPDDGSRPVDGEGFSTLFMVRSLLDGTVGMNEAIIGGGVQLRSSIDDALWMYQVIELMLDGASRVRRLRDLADELRDRPMAAPEREWVDWRTGTTEAEHRLLNRLGLLENQRVDHDAF